MNGLSRRDFLRITALMGGTSLFAGCHLFPESGPIPEYIQGAPGVDPLESLEGVRNIYSVCGLCPGNCGVRCRVSGGVLVKIDGNPYHPASCDPAAPFDTPLADALRLGAPLCAIGGSGVQTLYNPFRVARPLKRVGPRGSGKWKALTWDQAVKEIVHGGDLFGEGKVTGLKQIRESRGEFALLTGNGDWGSRQFLSMFLRGFPGGAFQFDRAQRLEDMFRSACASVFGPKCPGPVAADYRHARAVVSFGDAPLDSGIPIVSLARDIGRARTSGGGFKWAVVDPRLSVSASKADLWAPIIPGKEDRLVLGILAALSEMNGPGFTFPNETIQKAAREVPAAAHAQACGLPLDSALRMAQFLTEAGPLSAVIPGMGILAQENGGKLGELVLSLNLAVGSSLGSGGLMWHDEGYLDRAERRLYDSAAVPPVKPCGDPAEAVIVWATDPVYDEPTLANAFLTPRDGAKLLVAVSHEITETATLADYVLPDTTYLERWDLCRIPASVHGVGVGARRPVTGLVGPGGAYRSILPEARLMEDILAQLAAEAGSPGFARPEHGVLPPAKAFYDKALKIVLEEFGKDTGKAAADTDLDAVFTRGGRFMPKSGLRAAEKGAGETPAAVSINHPVVHAPAAKEPPADALRLILYSLPFHRSPSAGLNKWLLEITPENKLMMSAPDAARLKIRDLDEVTIQPFEGEGPRLSVKAQVVPGMRPGVVALARGFGYRAGGATPETVDGVTHAADQTLGKGVNPAGLTWVKITRA